METKRIRVQNMVDGKVIEYKNHSISVTERNGVLIGIDENKGLVNGYDYIATEHIMDYIEIKAHKAGVLFCIQIWI